MKTKIKWLAALVVALFVTFLAATSWAQGTLRFQVQAGIVSQPASSATYYSIAGSMEHNNPASGNWTPVANNSTIPLQSVFNYGTTGSGLRYAFAVVSDTAFSLSQIRYSTVNPSLSQYDRTFSGYNTGYGINKGPDNILGTSDDITYSSGNANALVHAVYMAGAGLVIDVGNTPLNEALESWSDFTYQEVTYTLFGENASSRINFGVPEPSSTAILLLGLIGLRTLKKRK
ncbi:MAG: PEP-CTERM sorting domain-containing protein [Patescibacteria group bacterium]